MALDGTYTGLLASMALTLNRRDLTAMLPDWVTLFEAQANRELRSRQKIIVSTATISTEYVATPADFSGPITVTLPDNSDLDSISPEALADKKRWRGTTAGAGVPEAYSVVGSEFQFFPAPNADFDVTLTYYQRFAPFSSAPNWLSANHIDIYFYGSLVHSAPYLKDDARLAVWGALLTKGMNALKSLDKKEAYGARLQPVNSSVV